MKSANSFSVTSSFYLTFYFKSINVLCRPVNRAPRAFPSVVSIFLFPMITGALWVPSSCMAILDSGQTGLDEGVAGPLRSGVLTCVRARAGQWGPEASRLAEVLQQLLQLPQTGLHVLLQPLLHGVRVEDATQGGFQLHSEGAPPGQEAVGPNGSEPARGGTWAQLTASTTPMLVWSQASVYPSIKRGGRHCWESTHDCLI